MAVFDDVLGNSQCPVARKVNLEIEKRNRRCFYIYEKQLSWKFQLIPVIGSRDTRTLHCEIVQIQIFTEKNSLFNATFFETLQKIFDIIFRKFRNWTYTLLFAAQWNFLNFTPQIHQSGS